MMKSEDYKSRCIELLKWAFVILGAEIIIILIVYWLKPEWLDRF